MNIGFTLPTPIVDLGDYEGNQLWIKRDDLIPFSFGGNKARKAQLFFREIDYGNYDCVVTYGSKNSNHCRIVANECCRRGLQCYIISPEDAAEKSFNNLMIEMFSAEIYIVPVEEVHKTIEEKIIQLRKSGKNPYFIEGGGHGNLGTQAYVDCYDEIRKYELTYGIFFEYIFFASGTGTTQSGLVCGQLLNHDERKIIGISIARNQQRGRTVVIDSVEDYLGKAFNHKEIQNATIFVDEYTDGYGKSSESIKRVIREVMMKYGIPLDETYTGKAFYGMTEYIKKKKFSGKKVLFIHTGGTPLFFDYLTR